MKSTPSGSQTLNILIDSGSPFGLFKWNYQLGHNNWDVSTSWASKVVVFISVVMKF